MPVKTGSYRDEGDFPTHDFVDTSSTEYRFNVDMKLHAVNSFEPTWYREFTLRRHSKGENSQ